ncbi:DUF2177 family protein [Sphingomonas sanxanigenens]|uniref:DUF2177 domain-containing protein n=1 Tax=Sphingomonas sanxanigenens DSM 19645 = NX02 TaxID=1123269 RepID=W0A9H7_9SPHN|nr:hypothetical protein NX02_02890 [Sphingomonas sanxanigenens DSM 19645 = NX02]
MRYAIGYLATALVFGLLDFVWLTRVGPGLYRPILGDLLAPQPRAAPAAIFYFLYVLAMMIFAVGPALNGGGWRAALLWGVLLGFFAYATYDLTNHATLRVWSVKITLLDMAWGSFATGLGALGGYWLTVFATGLVTGTRTG